MDRIDEKKLNINGLEIAYTECGASDGRLLFCVHGLLSNGRDYDFLALHLAQQGYRVVAIDLPGRGRSGWFTDKSHYALPYYIQPCLAVLGAVAGDKSFDWFGVSLGGMIGMALHGFEGLNIERLVLVDIGAEIPGSALDEVAALAKSPVCYGAKDEAVAFLKKRCSAWGISNVKVWEHLIAHNIREEASGFYLHYDPAIGAAMKDRNETAQFWEAWEKIRQPVLLVRGGKSRIFPASVSVQMQARYTGAKVEEIVFPDCGHVPNLMEEGQIGRVAAWLGHFSCFKDRK